MSAGVATFLILISGLLIGAGMRGIEFLPLGGHWLFAVGGILLGFTVIMGLVAGTRGTSYDHH